MTLHEYVDHGVRDHAKRLTLAPVAAVELKTERSADA